MSTSTIRRAAAELRAGEATDLRAAMALWLENEANAWDAANREFHPTLHYNAARGRLVLDVAKAVLSEIDRCPRRQCRGRLPHSRLLHWFGWLLP